MSPLHYTYLFSFLCLLCGLFFFPFFFFFQSLQSLSERINVPRRNCLLLVVLESALEERSTELRSVFWERLAFIQNFTPICSAVILAASCITL